MVYSRYGVFLYAYIDTRAYDHQFLHVIFLPLIVVPLLIFNAFPTNMIFYIKFYHEVVQMNKALFLTCSRMSADNSKCNILI